MRGDHRFDFTEDVECPTCDVEFSVSFNGTGLEIVFCPFCNEVIGSDLEDSADHTEVDDAHGIDGENSLTDEDSPHGLAL